MDKFFLAFNSEDRTGTYHNEVILISQLYLTSFETLKRSPCISKQELIFLVRKIAKSAGLSNVGIEIVQKNGVNAQANVYTNKIYLFEGCLNLEPEELAAVLGHEIAHLKSRDGTRLDLIRRFLGVIYLIFIFIACLWTIGLVSQSNQIVGLIITIILLPFLVTYELGIITIMLIDMRRFWYQIQEIKADRLACSFEGVTPQGMVGLLKRLNKEVSDYTIKPWYKLYYYRYFQLLEHPCLERRIYLIENFHKWSQLDYIKHSFIMVKWFFSGKGWIGE